MLDPRAIGSQSIEPAPVLSPTLGEPVRLISDSIINCSGSLLSAIIGIALIPIMLRGLGAELYGIWVITVTLSGCAGAILDLGLSWSVIREVAASHRASESDEAAQFVAAAANLYIVLALVGALVLGVLGLPISRILPSSPQSRSVVPAVLALAGAGFVASQMLNFQLALLRGLRRFDLVNLFSAVAALITAGGVVAILSLGGSLVSIAAWQAGAWAVAAVGALTTVVSLEPRFRLRLGRVEWSLIRPNIPFSLASCLVGAAATVLWESAPLLIGALLGPTSVAAYHVGRKFPVAISWLSWKAAEVFLPAASEHQRAESLANAQQTLEVSLRWIVSALLPLCITLWLVAPNLLQAWVGEAPPGVVLVLRLVTLAALANAIGEGPSSMLWGRGEVNKLLGVAWTAAGTNLLLNVWLLKAIGVVGAAWALVVSTSLLSVAVFGIAARSCGLPPSRLSRRVSKGLVVPLLACASVAFGLSHLVRPYHWIGLLGTGLAAVLAYGMSLYAWGTTDDERKLAREAIGIRLTALRVIDRRLRRTAS